MKKLLALTALTVIVLSSLYSHSLLAAQAEETPQDLQRYYTSIRIQPGDTMWQIAEEYAPCCGMSADEYVEELKSMNGIKEEVIHRGRYLTVLYCLPVEEDSADNPPSFKNNTSTVQYLFISDSER